MRHSTAGLPKLASMRSMAVAAQPRPASWKRVLGWRPSSGEDEEEEEEEEAAAWA